MKNINWKKIGQVFAWVFALALIGVLMSFVAKKEANAVCKRLDIYIPGSNFFIQEEELQQIMLQGRPIIGVKMSDLFLENYEQRLEANPYIKHARVYADMDGVLHVDIEQREPVLRVFNRWGQDFYVDSFGNKMPVSENYTAKVLAVNGNIDERFSYKVDSLTTPLLKDVYRLAMYTRQHEFWAAQIEQAYVNPNGDIELIPRVGSHTIVLGTTEDLNIKFRNLMAFYKQKMPVTGWNTYKTINLKFSGQIVCERSHNNFLTELPDTSAIETIETSILSQTLNNN